MAVTIKGSYTVIGIYIGTMQAFAQNVEAETVEVAFDIVARGWGGASELVIIGAAPVRTTIIPPDQDGGRAARAADLILDDEV